MFKKYFLVEMMASNKVKGIRSNCVMTTWFWQRPPLELAYQNCIELGYSVINILSVTRVSKKTADWLKKYVNREAQDINLNQNDPELKEILKKFSKEGLDVTTSRVEGPSQ